MEEYADNSHEIEVLSGADLVIISGMSGAGKTEALRVFEDLSYYCIDNLPPAMISALVDLVDLEDSSSKKLCVVCDVRSQDFFTEFSSQIEKLKNDGINYRILFLDAADQSLINRYSALRRRHPLARQGLSVSEAISKERKLLEDIKEQAHIILDTTGLHRQDLRDQLVENFSQLSAQQTLNVQVFSFGFKYGNPREADVVIDVRFLTNPYYVPELKALTGFDKPVIEYVLEQDQTNEFLDKWFSLLDTIMPAYVSEGKQHLAIGVGCTGGQHRSVVLAQKTAQYLKSKDYNVHCTHRDVDQANK